MRENQNEGWHQYNIRFHADADLVEQAMDIYPGMGKTEIVAIALKYLMARRPSLDLSTRFEEVEGA